MTKIYRVIQIKLNQFKKNVHTITDLPAKRRGLFKRCYSDKHLLEFLPTRWRLKSAGIDMEENYVTVILYIQSDFISYRGVSDQTVVVLR